MFEASPNININSPDITSVSLENQSSSVSKTLFPSRRDVSIVERLPASS